MPKKILDIGFSDYGRNLDWRGNPDKGFRAPKGTTIGLDPELIEDETPFEQVEGIAEDLPFEDASMDRITSSYTIGAHSHIAESIQEIVRALKPGGSAYFTVMVDGTKNTKDTFNKSRLEKYLKGFPITHLRVRSLYKVDKGGDYAASEVVQVSFRKAIFKLDFGEHE